MEKHSLDDDYYGPLANRYLNAVARYLTEPDLQKYAFSTIVWYHLRSELSNIARRMEKQIQALPIELHGEVLVYDEAPIDTALQWERVAMDDALVSSGEAHIKIDRELRRCSNESIEALERVNRSTVIFKFPKVMPKKGTTTLVLKAPKTESSNRIVYLPSAVVEELRRVQKQQEEYKALLGDEYKDYGLIVAQINGHPYEQRVIDKMFYDLIKKNNLRPVVFHSLRHSSTSLKLKLSRGNIKAVQGDTGHAEARMVTDTYAHGFDADRKLIAQEMDSGFFSKVGEQAKTSEVDNDTMDKLKALIQQHPELIAELLKGMEKDGIKVGKTG